MLTTEIVSANSFAALVACDIRLEPEPLLFRCQPNVEFVLRFQDYLAFRRTTKDADKFLLSYYQSKQPNKIVTPMTDDETMQRSFLMDVAVALGKEVYYAESQNAEGTRIVHKIPKVASLSLKDIDEQLTSFSLADVEYYISFMIRQGYTFKSLTPEHNQKLWNYALLCAYTAMHGEVWSFKC